ncbi:MAG: hypothetical protein MRJ96_04425 [Nitrospirales bacterium]|nr:hypothetical protein [Nitrospira sp.]MDR4500687.1 hypothetical protein [Nitrospirales bacterium]
MPLVQCPECQKEVSSLALSCPKCAFPYPGKKERLNGTATEKLLPCQDCGSLISKSAQSCPHCGAPIAQSVEQAKTERPPEPPTILSPSPTPLASSEPEEQTWLCPNCGVPYTRRLKGSKSEVEELNGLALQSAPPMASRRTNALEDELRQEVQNSLSIVVPRRERKRSPLWEEAKAMYEEEHLSSRPRPKKGVYLLVLVAVLLLSIVSLVFWGLEGLNPLEALVYWQM